MVVVLMKVICPSLGSYFYHLILCSTHPNHTCTYTYTSYIYIMHHRAIPTLKEKPPYFSPTLTDPQWLPDIQYEDIDRAFLTAEFSNNNNNANNSSGGNDGNSVGTGQVTTGSAGEKVLLFANCTCMLFVF